MSYIFELELIHFCFTSFNGFWATFPNISHLDPKTPLQPLKSPYDLCYTKVQIFSFYKEWEDLQAYGRSFPLEWIWVKHIPFKHMKVECLFLWGSTYLVYSIFKWKCLLSNCKLFKNACSWYIMSFEELGRSSLMVLQPWCFWESEFEFCPRTSKS